MQYIKSLLKKPRIIEKNEYEIKRPQSTMYENLPTLISITLIKKYLLCDFCPVSKERPHTSQIKDQL